MGKKITAFFIILSGILSAILAVIFSNQSRKDDRRGNNTGIDGQLEKERRVNSREGELNRDEGNAINREGKRLDDERSELDREKQSLDVEKSDNQRDGELLEELQKRRPEK